MRDAAAARANRCDRRERNIDYRIVLRSRGVAPGLSPRDAGRKASSGYLWEVSHRG